MLTCPFNRYIIKTSKGNTRKEMKEMERDENFGKVTLRGMRISRGITTEEAAKAIGVTTKTIYNYETGVTEPKISVVDKLLKLYKFDRTQIATKE